MSWFDTFGKKQTEESEELKNAKYNLKQAKEETKRIEQELAASKANEKKLKLALQEKCNHERLIAPKNKETSNNFNDYYAKCEYCEAEIFDHARSINYLNNLLDQLGKLSKVTESLKIAGVTLDDDTYSTFKKVNQLNTDLTNLRSKLSECTSSDYNNKLKNRIVNKKEER